MIKPLICLTRARDIPQVLDERKKLKYDQLWCNYITSNGTYPEVYLRMRNLFLYDERFKQYTHLVIAPDDLIVTNDHIETLVKDLEEFDYPVLSGVCNVDTGAQRDKAAICIRNLPNNRWDDGTHVNHEDVRFYDWASFEELDKCPKITKVLFSGFPLFFIRRDIVEQIEFETDYEWNPDCNLKYSASVDTTFCNRCFEKNIPIHVDTTVRMHHLRFGAMIKVGYKHKSIDWIQYRSPLVPSEHYKIQIFFEKIEGIRLVVAMSVREEAQFLPRTFESLKKLEGVDAIYVMDGSYMKGYHKISDSQDGTKAVCMAYKPQFKEFYFRPAMGRFYESQSEKRNLLFDWIESFDSDQQLWIFVLDGDEEIKWNDAFFNLKDYLKTCKDDLVFMQTNPASSRNHPLENSGVRIFRGHQGIRWDPEHTMRYINSKGEVLADYSPNMHLICTPHHFLNDIWIKNNWNEKPTWRIKEKQNFLQDRAKVTKERRAELV